MFKGAGWSVSSSDHKHTNIIYPKHVVRAAVGLLDSNTNNNTITSFTPLLFGVYITNVIVARKALLINFDP